MNMEFYYEDRKEEGKRVLSFKDENNCLHGPFLIYDGVTSITVVFYNHGQLVGPYLNYVYGNKYDYSITISTKVRELSSEFLNYGPTIVFNHNAIICGNKSDAIADLDELWVNFELQPEIRVTYSQADEESTYHNTDLDNVLHNYQNRFSSLNTIPYHSYISKKYYNKDSNLFIPIEAKTEYLFHGFYSHIDNGVLKVSEGTFSNDSDRGFSIRNHFSAIMGTSGKKYLFFNNDRIGITIDENTIKVRTVAVIAENEQERKVLEALGANLDEVIDLIKLSSNSLFCYSNKKKLRNLNYFEEVKKHKIDFYED